MAQTKVKTKGITDTNVTNAKLGTDISAANLQQERWRLPD